jgi:tetratricopeptide (TPR) repeat protein
VAAALSGGACAGRAPGAWASRFIVPGTPAVDLTVPDGPGPRTGAPPAPSAAPPVPAAALRAPAADTLEAAAPLLRERLAVLALAPSPRAYLDAAAAYRLYAVHDRAFDLVQQGLAAFPHDADLHADAAAAWRDWGLPDHGLRHAHLAVRYAPASAAAQTTLATVLWAVGAGHEALRAFERAAALAPEAEYARRNHCAAARALGTPPPAACGRPRATPEGR